MGKILAKDGGKRTGHHSNEMMKMCKSLFSCY